MKYLGLFGRLPWLLLWILALIIGSFFLILDFIVNFRTYTQKLKKPIS